MGGALRVDEAACHGTLLVDLITCHGDAVHVGRHAYLLPHVQVLAQ